LGRGFTLKKVSDGQNTTQTMHELLLFGQVPGGRHEQVLKVLAGFAAMQPQRTAELHQIYKPTVQPPAPVHVGGSQSLQQKPSVQNTQSRELVYMQLVEALDEAQEWPSKTPRTSWSLQYHELPDAAKRMVTMRMASTVDIAEGDPRTYMEALGYKYGRRGWSGGARLTVTGSCGATC